uniref:Uncharacterized protein n=1 Tax=Arundo donax TaxID=35708 RepID=A0A0A8Z2T4_ARUDO
MRRRTTVLFFPFSTLSRRARHLDDCSLRP